MLIEKRVPATDSILSAAAFLDAIDDVISYISCPRWVGVCVILELMTCPKLPCHL